MAVPDFQTIMLPLLKYASDGKEHTMKETRDALARELSLSEEDLSEMLSSGSMTTWANRVAWAKTYFSKMGIFDNVRRGVYRITESGKDVLKIAPKRITLNFLKEKFPEEFNAFRNLNNKKTNEEKNISNEIDKTPEELLESAYNEIHQSIAKDILDRVIQNSPEFFERLVVRLLVAMGYGGDFADAASVVGKSHDGGIDGIIKEDRLGLDNIYIQAKRWAENTVGAPEIQKFIGALHGKHAKKGIYITTSGFSEEAKKYAQKIDSHIVLIDGKTLAGYMIDFNVGVSIERSYEIKELDEDFFDENQ
jgi:restriction system protein